MNGCGPALVTWYWADRSHSPCSIVRCSKTPVPRRGFLFDRCLSVGDAEASADRQGGELVDRVAAGAPVREFVLIESLRHARRPFAGVRADHRAGIESPAIDAHRAAEAPADLERGLDDRVAREARSDRL